MHSPETQFCPIDFELAYVMSEPAVFKPQSSLIGKGRKIESGVGRIHEVDEVAAEVRGRISVFGVPNGTHPARERS